MMVWVQSCVLPALLWGNFFTALCLSFQSVKWENNSGNFVEVWGGSKELMYIKHVEYVWHIVKGLVIIY